MNLTHLPKFEDVSLKRTELAQCILLVFHLNCKLLKQRFGFISGTLDFVLRRRWRCLTSRVWNGIDRGIGYIDKLG